MSQERVKILRNLSTDYINVDDVQRESATKKDFGDRAKENQLQGLIAKYSFDTFYVSGYIGPWYEIYNALEDIKNHPKFYGGNPFGRFRDTVVLGDKGFDFIPRLYFSQEIEELNLSNNSITHIPCFIFLMEHLEVRSICFPGFSSSGLTKLHLSKIFLNPRILKTFRLFYHLIFWICPIIELKKSLVLLNLWIIFIL